jgi:hypothetical protein
MAIGFAVYASRCGSPTPHARLASPPEADWSGATGRAFHPQGSIEGFQSCLLHLIPLSQASCGNRIDGSVGGPPITTFGDGRRQLISPYLVPVQDYSARSRRRAGRAAALHSRTSVSHNQILRSDLFRTSR